METAQLPTGIALTCLTDREKMIFRMRRGLDDGNPKTLQYIGDLLGVTRERVRQLERKAMRKLRHPSRTLKSRPASPIDNQGRAC